MAKPEDKQSMYMSAVILVLKNVPSCHDVCFLSAKIMIMSDEKLQVYVQRPIKDVWGISERRAKSFKLFPNITNIIYFIKNIICKKDIKFVCTI